MDEPVGLLCAKCCRSRFPRCATKKVAILRLGSEAARCNGRSMPKRFIHVYAHQPHGDLKAIPPRMIVLASANLRKRSMEVASVEAAESQAGVSSSQPQLRPWYSLRHLQCQLLGADLLGRHRILTVGPLYAHLPSCLLWLAFLPACVSLAGSLVC
ncbi:uncharacterized protein K460DRAFT_369734 [Cucurbitaria berberidis CBS 394.84]|uniref:Uncharacterized protein n=1 Tax=Cucurbitaria berberidis CBS 394.84 TaxID=1168544 RepID=A0A9P4G9N9_9PLEO|nr:uncharacterized protein K460DRAFT_369734 [Cucurbitaria berberidis CBS 394.84]KAF1841728.1 hypothetical protein K460DRAFT_369734 [Cucurbitaria berberidis CBS 394.84]